ncbi:MAG: efflux RND transporter periplasmic adaptor subunit [Planctomycetota bacterium]|nr:efflux RND transporter periplasmic adaptor subunit [Planctomycetota bacterium]
MTLAATAACGQKPFVAPTMTVIPVRIAVAQRSTIPVVHRYPSVLASPRPVQLTARVAGYLLRQEIPDGAAVHMGDVVYRIDSAQYVAQLQSAEASLIEALASKMFADDEVVRSQPLVVAGAISQQNFDKLVTSAVQAAGQVQSAQAQVEIQQLNVNYCEIASPLDGVLGKSNVYEGSMVGPGYATDLNLVVQTSPMWAQFSPSSTEWPVFMSVLQKGELSATVQYGMDGPIAHGKVVFHNNVVGQSTGTLLMRVEFPDATGVFIPGALAEVRVTLTELENAITVPLQAVWARETQLFVWRIKSDDSVESVAVTSTMRDGTVVVIAAGINAGDRIVSAGFQKLREGTKVTEAPATYVDKPGDAPTTTPNPASSSTTGGAH